MTRIFPIFYLCLFLVMHNDQKWQYSKWPATVPYGKNKGNVEKPLTE